MMIINVFSAMSTTTITTTTTMMAVAALNFFDTTTFIKYNNVVIVTVQSHNSSIDLSKWEIPCPILDTLRKLFPNCYWVIYLIQYDYILGNQLDAIEMWVKEAVLMKSISKACPYVYSQFVMCMTMYLAMFTTANFEEFGLFQDVEMFLFQQCCKKCLIAQVKCSTDDDNNDDNNDDENDNEMKE